MILKNPKLLCEIRRERCCWCRRYATGSMHAAHIFARGLGGGHRQDTRANVVCLCSICHVNSHNGEEPTRADLLTVIASRFRCLVEDVRNVYHLFERLDKDAPMGVIAAEAQTLSEDGKRLFWCTWNEHCEAVAQEACQ